jgi:TonB-linked SusC/RagA family outer membrane protein
MKTKFSGILTLLLAFVVQLTFAQEKTISGNITDEGGLPLPGVNVIVKGTSTGTQSDFDGNYSIQANVDQSLTYSYVGYQSTERPVTAATSNISFAMEPDTSVLNTVVVTAQGITREKKSLGYAVSTVSSEQIEQQATGDIARVLEGKTAGVAIQNQSGISGSGTSVVIRGYNSFSGSNQALFIVDGVPFSSDTNAQGGFTDGNNGSSRFLDLDPNNIESISVLKGLAAATLYGTQGKNGVILITTKNGRTKEGPAKTEIEITQSVFFNEIASLPDYQNSFGNGFDQAFGWFFSNWGPSFNRDGLGGWGSDGAFDENGTLPHPYLSGSFADQLPEGFVPDRYDWKPYDNVKDFFRTGIITNTSVNVRGGSENATYNTNFSHLDEKGFTPGNGLRRSTFGIGGRAKLSNKFTVTGAMNYAKTDFVSPPVSASTGNGAFGSGSSVFGDVFFSPRSIDIQGLPYENPATGGSIYYRQNNSIQHPLWTVANARNEQLTNRFFGNSSVQYDFNDNLNVVYRFGIDFYNERNTNSQNRGGVNSNNPTARVLQGVYDVWDNNNIIYDHNILLNGDYDLSDKVGVSFNVGATSRHEKFDQNGIQSQGQVVFGVLRHNNFTDYQPIQFTQERNILGVYGSTSIDYNNFIYATISARNDWASNFSEENRSLFYPSASLSFIPTQAFDGLRSDGGVSFLKLRAGYGTSAGFAAGYPTFNGLNTNTVAYNDSANGNGVLITNSTSFLLANPDIKPERVDEIEFGVEATLINRRVNLDLSYYERVTQDLIVNQPIAPSTGYTTTTTNIGEITGYGIEAAVDVDLFKSETNGFTWNAGVNFTKNDSEVTELVEGTDQIIYAGFTNLGNAAQVGQPLGIMVGSAIQRVDQNNPALVGNAVVDGVGNYISLTQDENGLVPIIGNPNPDFIMAYNNTMSFKNFSLNVLVTHTSGGDIYSNTIKTLLGRGLTTDTEDRLGTYILPGVNVDDETGAATTNTTQVNNSDYYFANVAFGPDELAVYDASVIRLQEVSLAYKFPAKMLEKTPFGSFSITLSGNNLWYDAYNTPDGTNFDPNVAGLGVGNGRGFDYLNGPSSRRYGFSLKATF